MYNLVLYYMEKGGLINGLIFLVCFVVVYIGTGRLVIYRQLSRGLCAIASGAGTTAVEPALSGLAALSHENTGVNMLREELLRLAPQLDNGLDTMAAWIATAPLLGLLGTVTGMIQTFRIIMVYGVGNPGLLSQGISVALLTTQAGLLVAFPCLLFHNYLKGRRETLVKQLLLVGEGLLSATSQGGTNA